MKNLIWCLITVAAIAILVIAIFNSEKSSETLNLPEAKGYVNDYADILSPETEAKLEADLKEYKPEIAVLTVKSLNGLNIDEYGIRIGNAWKTGDAEKDDGVIFIIATEDRKVKIEVGTGSEVKINDAKAGRILDESVVPHLKNDDWERGILEGVLAIKSALK